MNQIPPWMIAVLSFSAGAMLMDGWWSNAHKAEINQIKAAQAQVQAETERQTRERLEDAQARGDTLTARLAATEEVLHTKTQEVNREIARLTTGRPCLGADVVRLLNQPANSSAGAVPQAPGQPVAQDGAAASDTDIAGWIAGAQSQYETCRARLGALIDFEEGFPQ
jgi:hypothetical protein